MEYEICAELASKPDRILPDEHHHPSRPVSPRANRDDWWTRNHDQRGILIPEEEV